MKRLPLSLFEEYMLHADQPLCPAWMFMAGQFRGTFEHAALQEAARIMVNRHPMMRSIVRWQRGRWVWEQMLDWCPVIEWETGPRMRDWPQPYPLDLRREPALRIVAIEHLGGDGKPEATSLFWQLHHALCDSVGMTMIFEDLLIAYAQIKGSAVIFTKLDVGLLPQRNDFGLTWFEKVKLGPGQMLGLLACWKMHRQKAVPLAPGGIKADLPALGAPVMISRRFSAEERRHIGVAAKKQGVMANDFFIRDFHAALGLWRKERGLGRSADWVRLVVPVSLRRSADRFLPAVNVLSAISINRSPKTLEDRERLLRVTLADMSWVKKRNLGYTFLTLLWLCRLAPGGLRRYARRPQVHGTAILSNLGQLFAGNPLQNRARQQEVPGAVMEDFKAVTPFQKGACVALDAYVYAGRLMFDLNYDPRVLSEVKAERLMELFIGQLRLSVEETIAWDAKT